MLLFPTVELDVVDSPKSVKDLSFDPVQEVFPSPHQWRDHFFYHLLIDRFDNNAPEESPAGDGNSEHVEQTRVEAKFRGGTIAGITRRLDYLRGLGCTAIWISPPFKNRLEKDDCYHGYGIQDFLAVDPRFGTLEDLQELVRQAHARDMYVVIDIVVNHTGDNWAYENDDQPGYADGQQYPFGYWRRGPGDQGMEELGPEDGVWPVELQRAEAYQRKGRINNMGDASRAEAMDGDFGDFKDLALEDRETLNTLIRCYRWWIAQTDCDGYRIDTVKHTNSHALATFCNAIREYAMRIGKTNFLLFGEVVGDDTLLQKYIGQNTPVIGEEEERYPRLDACLDFPLYFVLEEIIKGSRSVGELSGRYQELKSHYRDYGMAGDYYITFIDNHDQMHRPFRRLLHEAEDPRIAVLGIGYLLTSMGIPCIYYGTEQGFDGGGDNEEYVREQMFGGGGRHFFDPEHPLYREIGRIAAVRREQPVLRYGRQYFRQTSADGIEFSDSKDQGQTLAYCRILDNATIYVAMNLGGAALGDYLSLDDKFLSAGTRMVDLLGGGEYDVVSREGSIACVHIPLEAHQMAILKAL